MACCCCLTHGQSLSVGNYCCDVSQPSLPNCSLFSCLVSLLLILTLTTSSSIYLYSSYSLSFHPPCHPFPSRLRHALPIVSLSLSFNSFLCRLSYYDHVEEIVPVSFRPLLPPQPEESFKFEPKAGGTVHSVHRTGHLFV